MKTCEFFTLWPGECGAPAIADIPYHDCRKWFCAEHYDIVTAHYRKMFLDYGDTWPALAEVANL